MLDRILEITEKKRLRGLLQRGPTLPLRRLWFTVIHETRYIYEHPIRTIDVNDFMPHISNFTLHIVSTNQQADALEANGYGFRNYQQRQSRGLDIGAIAFCMFVGQELAHIGWVALTEEAKPYVDSWHYHVDFTNKEACTGSSSTLPQYEGKGLFKYGYYKRFEYLSEMEIEKVIASVDIKNTASNNMHAKFHPKIRAKVKYLKILGWESWKEWKLDTQL
jgi:hypothetical protein